jgi:energy-coupling factor transport system substrate-specific component
VTSTSLQQPVHVSAIKLRLRATVILTIVSLFGLAAFTWPLFVGHTDPNVNVAHASDAPYILGVLLILLLGLLASEISAGGIDAKALALLGILGAVGAVMRPFATGATGFTLVFFLLIPAGRIFGKAFGFVLGALTLFVSGLLTAGVGPWLPFQMLGAAWVGFFAACLPRRVSGRWEIWMLSLYGALAGLGYGLLLNLWFWPLAASGTTANYVAGASVVSNVHRFLVFDVTTSLGTDVPRAIGNFLLVLLAGPPVLRALRRAARRAAFDAPVEFTP